MGPGRAPCCDKTKVKKGPWSPAEDLRLRTFVQNHGHNNWRALPKQAGLLRCGKSCRLRWINYLRSDVKRGNFTPEEEETIINLHNSIGNKWSKIASYLPGRTDNEIKNIWNTHLKKKIKNQSKEFHCHNKTEVTISKPNSSASASESSTSSSIALFEDLKSKNSLINQDIEKSDSSKNPEDSISDHSPSPSYALNSNSREKMSDFSNTEIISLDGDEKIEIPLMTYIDFWEIFDSLGENHKTETPKVCEQDVDFENDWFRVLENELGLDCDMDTFRQCEALNDFGSGVGAKN